MADKKTTKKKQEDIERIYVIPLRKEINKVPRYKKTSKAIKAIKQFIARHMKIYDRDLNKIKIDSYLNEYMWARGIKNPQTKVKVKASKVGEIVTVELVDYPDKLKFKKARLEKAEKAAKGITDKKKKEKAQALEEAKKAEEQKTDGEKKQDIEKKEVEKEKATAGAEAAQKLAETQAKQAKKQKIPSMKQPKHQKRKALAK